MNNQIQTILEDLYTTDPSLKKHERELAKIVEELLASKPDAKLDPNFKEQLKTQLDERIARLEARENKGVFLQFTNFLYSRKFGYLAGAAAVFVLMFAGASYWLNQDSGEISEFIRNRLPVVADKLILGKKTDKLVFKDKTDDWQYQATEEAEDSRWRFLGKTGLSPLGLGSGAAFPQAAPLSLSEGRDIGGGSIGLSVGGAKDISNFRENIEKNYLPLPTDITYEGLFYDYYFDTGEQKECQKLFCPSYTYALSADPFSKNQEYYLSVGLNSGIKESDFQRKKLNLVIVLDISGSMSSSFDRYYYDQFGRRIMAEGLENDEDYQKTKMELAAQSVVGLLNHLNDSDRLGVVLFDDQAYLAKPLNFVGETDVEKIKKHILEIQPQGGTQMSAGMKMGTELFDEIESLDQSEYENRIIFLTDAMPNLGETSEQGLLGMTKSNAANKIYSTFIGIGVDFNSELVEYITKIRGANYYSVHSPGEFKQRMDDEFEYMVTPLVFNLLLTLEAQGYQIEKVYGSPEANEATGEIMKVNTLFPSKKEAGQTKGGLVLLKLKKLSPEASLKLKISYEDRSGKADGDEAIIEIKGESEFFANTGIRKGILLTRYANLVKNWIIDERKSQTSPEPLVPAITDGTGIILPFPEPLLGRWERQSIPLQVSLAYQGLFKEFSAYFEKEMTAIGDDSLDQELVILKKLSSY